MVCEQVPRHTAQLIDPMPYVVVGSALSDRLLVADITPQLPPSARVQVVTGKFDETMTKVLDQIDSQAQLLAPSFVMVDPFGVSGTPMSVIQRIVRNPRSEVYISFMYEAMNRFKDTEEFERHLDDLFGTPAWREGISITDPVARKQFFYGLYESQLRQAGATYVVHFDLYEGNPINSLKNLDKSENVWVNAGHDRRPDESRTGG